MWEPTGPERLLVFLRYLVRSILILNGVIIGLVSIYVTSKFAWYVVRFMDEKMPW